MVKGLKWIVVFKKKKKLKMFKLMFSGGSNTQELELLKHLSSAQGSRVVGKCTQAVQDINLLTYKPI